MSPCFIKKQIKFIFLNNAFVNEQKLQDLSVSFAIFSKTFAKVKFFVNASFYFVLFHMFAKHDQFCKQQTVFKVSLFALRFAMTSLLNLGTH